jgi:5-methyltetrahydropteroyltriglutamate--homocysteine methyltransferase
MQRSTDRILTTHTGSLPRPEDLIAMMREKENHRPYDEAAFMARVRESVLDTVRRQCEIGIAIPGDGEQSKSGFATYQSERFGGFEPANPQPPRRPAMLLARDQEAFAEYYADYFSHAMMAASLALPVTFVCTGPVQYIGQAAVRRDIETLKEGLQASGHSYTEAFMPSANPLNLASIKNEYYRTQEEFEEACIEATRAEYQAILDAGLILQVDDPGLGTNLWDAVDLPEDERARKAEAHLEKLNHALRGLPQDRIRYHSCYSVNQGPMVYSMPLREWIGYALRVNAEAISFEAMNPRHMHDYHTFEDVHVPDGKTIVPGMLNHGHNWVEHPELIAELTVNYAKLVGRENVQISTDCGFASQAGAREVHPTVVWAKLAALVEGAELASRRLWGQSAASQTSAVPA